MQNTSGAAEACFFTLQRSCWKGLQFYSKSSQRTVILLTKCLVRTFPTLIFSDEVALNFKRRESRKVLFTLHNASFSTISMSMPSLPSNLSYLSKLVKTLNINKISVNIDLNPKSISPSSKVHSYIKFDRRNTLVAQIIIWCQINMWCGQCH